MEHLDSGDPTMNLALLKLLVGDDKGLVLPEVGYEEFERLTVWADQFYVAGDRLWKRFANTAREVPSVKNRL